MTRRDAERRPGEFALIERLFAPLAKSMPGAFDLTDDVALFAPSSGQDVVLKTDSLIESVHFLREDPAKSVGRKALRRALSDLAAKAAEPVAWLLALALPDWPDLAWLEDFAEGLAADQLEFGIVLAGGETNATPGPLTLTVTAVGEVPEGKLIRRNGARPGDQVFVTGTIGDSGGGLELSMQSADPASKAARGFLLSRYQLPLPRFVFGRALRGIAAASIDVSDGLLADCGHIADVSGVRIEIDADRVPLSDALRELWGDDCVVRAATAGDDYEIAFTAPASQSDAILEASRQSGTPVTSIGRVIPGHGVALLDTAGRAIPIVHRGYTHF
jgi:thiamine-monophosphate kinase